MSDESKFKHSKHLVPVKESGLSGLADSPDVHEDGSDSERTDSWILEGFWCLKVDSPVFFLLLFQS